MRLSVLAALLLLGAGCELIPDDIDDCFAMGALPQTGLYDELAMPDGGTLAPWVETLAEDGVEVHAQWADGWPFTFWVVLTEHEAEAVVLRGDDRADLADGALAVVVRGPQQVPGALGLEVGDEGVEGVRLVGREAGGVDLLTHATTALRGPVFFFVFAGYFARYRWRAIRAPTVHTAASIFFAEVLDSLDIETP